LQAAAAHTWVSDRCPASGALGDFAAHAPHDRLRIGYFSSDFRDHAVSHLMAEVFERHDRSRFELTAFSFGPDTGDAMRRRVSAAFERFIDVRGRSAAEVARLARQLEIDIAVDLNGFTQGGQTNVFAFRAAPLQASYVGFLGTMGADYYDYLIADRAIVPEGARAQYSEKIACLPSYQANDSTRPVPERKFSREALGLPPTGFVYCCFNNNYKITPRTFDGWMRILAAVEGSVLFLYADNDLAPANLRKEASRRGVDPRRLVFGERLPLPDYLARYLAADLFLDTLPYNAGATASDALWSGLPVLTCLGESFAGRVGGSLLAAIGLPELAVPTQEAYEARAIALARDPAALAAIRQRLACNRLSTPLFDTAAFTRHLEAAFRAMHERHEAGLPPEHFCAAC
jgi:predicted O-linked N-acetylglucosamine transferase (SPINDLY family)